MLKLLAALSLLVVTTVLAYSDYQKRIPNGNVVPSPCGDGTWHGVGHWLPGGTGDLNPFGRAFKANGYTWNFKLCREDSDGDGRRNGEELGDPGCDWLFEYPVQLDPPQGHPGICEPVDSPGCQKLQPNFTC
ncbi:MOXD1 homolog 1-like isoform X3 [Elysia marginata]|uniref:MOXD1 homolog 1-like isoform X3 n=1 Tax=Elysia marginata TaxID=1093978 RepID=A0AAV4IFK3_9GAST|nr:MOXD1 homolog 1-like isoform X3 [Elysia marginata]